MSIDLAPAKARSTAVTGGVDISGFPQLLMTREFGDPDTLFMPLLKSAREALEASKALAASGQGASQASMMASIHLATALLKDSNFTLGSKGSLTQNYYLLDLEAGTIHLRTWLFATVNKRTSTFLVKISGSIPTGVFTVQGAADESVLAKFDEQRLAQPEFFANTLSEECLRLQMSKDHFKRFGDLPMAQAETGVRFSLESTHGTKPVFLKKKDEGWEVLDEQAAHRYGMLAPDLAQQLEHLIHELGKLSSN